MTFLHHEDPTTPQPIPAVLSSTLTESERCCDQLAMFIIVTLVLGTICILAGAYVVTTTIDRFMQLPMCRVYSE